jgi:hypothetical protein
VGRPEGRRPLGEPRRRWEDNIKMNLQEAGWGMNWFDMAQDRNRWRAFVNAVMNIRVTLKTEVLQSSETSVTVYQSTRCHIR